MRKIRILNLHKAYRLNERLVEKIVTQVLKFCKKPKALELEFVFLDNKRIRELNKKYKRSNRPTDVLSFGMKRDEFGLPFYGEIIISLDRALENSKIFGTEFNSEVTLYIIHGILHLFGYDDETVSEKRRMSGRQLQILESICTKEKLSKVLMRR